MISLFQNKTYLIIFAVIIFAILCILGYMMIRRIVKNEIKNIYKAKRKKGVIHKKGKKVKINSEVDIQPIQPIEHVPEYLQQDMDNQSYMDPLQYAEYQNYNSNVAKDNILMRDIMDGTPNNRYQ